MEKREFGWCAHVNARGFFRTTGGSTLVLDQRGEVLCWWERENLMFFACLDCFKARHPGETLRLLRVPGQEAFRSN